MSTIKAFTAMSPDLSWYKGLLNPNSEPVGLKSLLEPAEHQPLKLTDLHRCKNSMERLLLNGNYNKAPLPGIYIYERQSAMGSQFGVWSLTSLEDFRTGIIINHEETLKDKEEVLRIYRSEVGLEGSPVLLTHHRHPAISQIIESTASNDPEFQVLHERSFHKLWQIRDIKTIEEIQEIFSELNGVYVADGHHRLAAANLMHKSNNQQWISTLYIASDMLHCRGYHRMVLPLAAVDKESFFSDLEKNFYLSTVPNNKPYRPNKRNRFGMYFQGTWYQLDLKAALREIVTDTDAEILQNLVMTVSLGISEPRNDNRLSNHSDLQWDELIKTSESQSLAIVFSMFPMSADEIIAVAEKRSVLPPKSTYVEPKIPFGLLIYQNPSNKNSEAKTFANTKPDQVNVT